MINNMIGVLHMDKIPFNIRNGNLPISTKIPLSNDDSLKDIMDTLDEVGEDSFYSKNLALAAYIIVFSETSSQGIDNYLNKYQSHLPKTADTLETKLLPMWNFYGVYMHRYNKLRYLATVVLHFFNNDLNKAFAEIKSIFLKILMNSEYKTIIRYINNTAVNSKSIEKYWDYLDVKFNNLTKQNDLMKFMKYNMVYSFFSYEKIVDRFNDLTKSPKTKNVLHYFEILEALKDLVKFQNRVYSWVEERTQDEQLIIESKNIINKAFNERTKPMEMSLEKRVRLFIVSLILSGEMDQRLSKKETEKILAEKTGYKDGKVNAAALVNALNPFEKRTNDIQISDELKRFFEIQYNFEYFILKRYGVDMETLLNTTYLNDDDLIEIVSSYALTGEFERSIFRSLLSPINEYSCPIATINDFGNVRDAFVPGKDYVIRGIISTALAKHLQITNNEMDVLFLNAKHGFKSSSEVLQAPKKEEPTEQLKDLQKALNDLQNDFKLYRIQSQNKEQIIQDKLMAKEQEYNNLLEEYQIVRENYDMLFDNVDLDDIDEFSEGNIEENEIKESKDEDSFNYIEAIRDLKICIVGGFDNFHSKIGEAFIIEPTIVKSRFYNYPLNILLNQDVVVHVATHNNHSQYKRVRDYMKRNNIKDRFMPINAQHSPELLAKKIYHFIHKHERR